jgi:hypothetical protein
MENSFESELPQWDPTSDHILDNPKNARRKPAALMFDDIDAAVKILTESGHPGAERVAAALDKWRSDRKVSFENALGYLNGVRRSIRQTNRDAALRRIAAQLDGSASQTRAAVLTYTSYSWPDDKKSRVRPEGLAGDCYDVMRNGGPPSSRMHIHRILAE